jgi:hypothetical protein
MNGEAVAMDRHKKSVNKFTSEDRFFSAIGRFIFEFSQLEYTLKHHVAEEINLREEHFNAIMTHDFALLCTVAETVLVRPEMSDNRADRLRRRARPASRRSAMPLVSSAPMRPTSLCAVARKRA